MKKKVTFTLPVAALGNATEAMLLGDFNNWNPENGITLVEIQGVLTTTIELETGRSYEYKYFLNDGKWVNDWNAESYAFNAELNIENSLITLPQETVTATKKVAEKKTTVKKIKEEKTAAPKKASTKKAAPAKKVAAKKSVKNKA